MVDPRRISLDALQAIETPHYRGASDAPVSYTHLTLPTKA